MKNARLVSNTEYDFRNCATGSLESILSSFHALKLRMNILAILLPSSCSMGTCGSSDKLSLSLVSGNYACDYFPR